MQYLPMDQIWQITYFEQIKKVWYSKLREYNSTFLAYFQNIFFQFCLKKTNPHLTWQSLNSFSILEKKNEEFDPIPIIVSLDKKWFLTNIPPKESIDFCVEDLYRNHT